MIHLRKFVAPEFIFGQGSRLLAGQYARNLGANRVLVVTDPGVIAAGWAGDVMDSLEEAGVAYSCFSALSANPRAEEVMAGADVYRAGRCDAIVAVGGGSSMDCAKGIGLVIGSGGHISKYEGVDVVPNPGPPLICIPTTAGSSADISQFAIINDNDRRTKFAIVSKMAVPDVSLIDPETTTTMDAALTASTGLDALVHAVEAFVSLANSPIVDMHALHAVHLVAEHLPAAVADPADLGAREGMMQASMHAGLAFSNACLGAVHAMAHSLGGMLDLPHGECNALLLEHVLAFNYSATPERYDRLGKEFGLDLRNLPEPRKVKALVEGISTFKRRLGVEGGLKARGVSYDCLGDLAANALRDVCLVSNPRSMNRADIEAVFAEAL